VQFSISGGFVRKKSARANIRRHARCAVRERELHGDCVLHHRLHGRTLYASGHRDITDAAQAAQALIPLAGRGGCILFAFGLLNASLFRGVDSALSTAHVFCEGLVSRRASTINQKARFFYWLYTILIVVGPVLCCCRTHAVENFDFFQVGTVLAAGSGVFILLLVNAAT